MDTRSLRWAAAAMPFWLAACSQAEPPVTGKTESPPAVTRPAATDTSASAVPSAGPVVGGAPTPEAKASASTSDMSKAMSKQDESSRMPMTGQGNNHSAPDALPQAPPPAR